MKKKIYKALIVTVFTGCMLLMCIHGIDNQNGNRKTQTETEVVAYINDSTEGELTNETREETVNELDKKDIDIDADTDAETNTERDTDTETDSASDTCSANTTNQMPSTKPGTEMEVTSQVTLGCDLSYGESIVTDNNIEVPVLNKFNEAGLNPICAEDESQDWFGYIGDIEAAGYQNVKRCATAMNDLTEALGVSGGFVPQWNHIGFSFSNMEAEVGDIELRRDFDSGYYTIGINYDMSEGTDIYGREIESYEVQDGQDVLILLCSVISSTPAELADFLYAESFENEEEQTTETAWIVVGDCQVQWGGYNANGMDELVYRIKSK